MTTRFDRLNMSALAPPNALENWSFDGILAARFQKFLDYWSAERAKNPALPLYDVTKLRGNPGAWHQLADTFREGLVRQRINEAVLATSLAFAVKDDLDAVVANYNVARQTGETDDSLRLRGQLAWETLTIGGSYGGYEYWARTAAPADLADVRVYGNEIAGVAREEVCLVLLGAVGNGVVSQVIIDRVLAMFPRAARKVNDRVTARQANLNLYEIDATLILPTGVSGQAVRDAQYARALAYAASRQMIGAPVTFPTLMGALGDDDAHLIVDVEMREPFTSASLAQIGGGPFDAPICTGVKLDWRAAA